MTSQHEDRDTNHVLLEQLLQRVQSIDRNVEEILDRLTDYFDDARADLDWRQEGYWNGNGYDPEGRS